MKAKLIFPAIIASTLITLQGCSTTKLPPIYTPKPETTYQPKANQEAVTEVGESLIKIFKLIEYPAVEIKKDATFTSIGGATYIIPAGTHSYLFERAEGKYYSEHSYILLGNNRINNYRDSGIIISSNDETASLWSWNPISGKFFYGGSVDAEPTVKQVWEPEKLKREFIYMGSANNVAKISYREYIDNLARPAFYQDLTFDLNESNIIGFRGSRFKIIKATNSNIRYVMLKPFE